MIGVPAQVSDGWIELLSIQLTRYGSDLPRCFHDGRRVCLWLDADDGAVNNGRRSERGCRAYGQLDQQVHQR